MEPFDSKEGEEAPGVNPVATSSESRVGSLLNRIRGKHEDQNTIHSKTPKSADPLDDESKIVTARGTEDGLVLRIDGKSPWDSILSELNAFLGSRKRFLEGGEVSIEWLERLPTPEQSFELEQYLREGFGVEVVSRRRRPAFTTIVDRSAARSQAKEGSNMSSISPQTPNVTKINPAAAGEDVNVAIGEPLSENAIDLGLNQLQGVDHYDSLEEESQPQVRKSSKKTSMERVLKDTIEILEDPAGPSYLRRVSKLLGEDLVYEEDANAKVVFGHFRSGQRLETPYSLVVIGDVNPGADLIAGGDIFVLGSLRGTAHAAAYDDEALDRVVVALSMQPVQLRIGSILSRGNGAAGKGPEVARIENRRIIVEGFNSRVNLRKKSL